MSTHAPAVRRRLRGLPGAVEAQAVVEFALLLPILVIFILIVAEFGRAFYTYHVLTDAAREAARQAVVADGLSAAEKQARLQATIIEALAFAGVNTAGTTMVPEYCGGTLPSGSAATVEIYGCGWSGDRGDPAWLGVRAPYRLRLLEPFLFWQDGGSALTLGTAFTMRNE
jgi:hypothetical protein